MSNGTADALIDRAVEHCERHAPSHFTFVFHGGEPLLARPAFFQRFVKRANLKLPKGTKPLYSMQTNGTLLTRQWCEVLLDLEISLGISIDGPKEVHDSRRVDHSGKGSYDRIRRGWELAVSCGIRPGLLAVIDVATDPRDIFEHIKELNPRSMDFLFPDATYEKLPPHFVLGTEATAYADWLLRMFNLWVDDERASFEIRIFERIIRNVLGLPDKLDALGPGTNEVLVVETDGTLEAVDVLKICRDGITKTALNVATSSLDEAFENPLIKLYYFSNEQLCRTCQKCLVNRICAGGYLPHRYRNDGFDNPSVYCHDLMKLITGIQNWVHRNLPADIATRLQFAALSYAEARAAIAERPASVLKLKL